MGIYKQLSFAGGMDLISSDTDIANTAYRQAFNFRQRYGKGETIPTEIDITYNLGAAGKFQGIYAVGNVFISFFGGKAYYMLIGDTQWLPIAGFLMNQNVDFIYAQPVPASTNSFFRQGVVNTQNGNVDASLGIINATIGDGGAFSVTGTPAGIVCQDGINQPFLIFYDTVDNIAFARPLQNYDQWSNDTSSGFGREYVPIGTLMMYLDGRLYIVNGSTIYRSVSGRALDFMVNVDSNGNKLPTEDLGGANSTSFAIDFEPITALVPSTVTASTAANGASCFTVGTTRFVYTMQPDFNVTIFAEPTFDKVGTIEAGIVNQFCVTDSNGDTPFIDFESVKFFNAVQSLKFKGENSPLSKNISKVLVGITQDICCCTSFDNYNLFALNSIYGYITAIYDNMSSMWVSLDLTLANAAGIKMFAVGTNPGLSVLVCGNSLGKLYQLFSTAQVSSSRQQATVFLREFVSGEVNMYGTFIYHPLTEEHKLNYIKGQMTPGTIDGTIFARSYVDKQLDQSGELPIVGKVSSINYPVQGPVIPSSLKRSKNFIFTFDQGVTGYGIQPMLSWNTDATLNRVEMDSTDITQRQSEQEQQDIVFNMN